MVESVNRRFGGGIIPFKMTKNGIRIFRSADIADPKYESGLMFRINNWHIIADVSGQMMSWGRYPIPDIPTEIFLKPLKPKTSLWQRYHWTANGVWCPREAFTLERTAGNYPQKSTHRKCVGCGNQSYWIALSYIGGSTSCRTYGFCVDCTLKGGQNIKPSGGMICRICRKPNPDVLLYSEEIVRDPDVPISPFVWRWLKKVKPAVFEIPIHNECRINGLISISEKPILKWREIPSGINVNIG